MDEIDIKFDLVKLMVGCQNPVALNLKASRLSESFTMYGVDIDDRSMATFNNVCHELSHGFIAEYLSSDNLKPGSLHEGIADMVGIYCDWKFNSNLNWVFGYESNTGNLLSDFPRNLSDPLYDCYSDKKDLEQPEINYWQRGMPLGHLFYLLVEGGSSYGAPILSVEIAIKLILDGLPELSRDNPDYPQLRDATINQALENFEYCYDEVIALVKAWEKICLDTDFEIKTGPGKKSIKAADCEYFVTGTTEACWNVPNAQICLNVPDSISHGINPAHNTWTITGPGSVDFESSGGMVGNQQQGGVCLNLNEFPEVEYYPRWYNIRLDFNTNEGNMSINHRLLMYDCTGTKPDCETYHGQRIGSWEQENEKDDPNLNEKFEEIHSTMEVFDLLGRLLYQGSVLNINFIQQLPNNQVLIIRYLDKKGRVTESHKTMKIQ